MKASRLSERIEKCGDCYAIAEQAIEVLFFMFEYFCCPQIKALVVCQVPVNCRGESSTDDKNKKYK